MHPYPSSQMSNPWRADPLAVNDAARAFASALEAFAGAPAPKAEALAALLGAVGLLSTLDAESALAPALAEPATARRETLFGAFDRDALVTVLDRDAMSDALEDSAVQLCSILDDNDNDDERAAEPASREAELTALLAARDRAEHELLGAAFILGCAPEALQARSAATTVWDSVVQSKSWRLVAFNHLRQAALRTIAPRLRARFWWWHTGAGIPAEAVTAMSAAAQLAAQFPAARARFESLVRAETIWRSPVVPAQRAPSVRTLRRWLSGKANAAAPDMPLGLPLAAAAGDEVAVMETPDLQISFAAPGRLILDLLADRRPGTRPSLRTSSGLALTAASVAFATERFAFELTDAILDDPRVSLSVPLESGDLTIVLPEPDAT
jgi:hypothetical protein